MLKEQCIYMFYKHVHACVMALLGWDNCPRATTKTNAICMKYVHIDACFFRIAKKNYA